MAHTRYRLTDGRKPFIFQQFIFQVFNFPQILKKEDKSDCFALIKENGPGHPHRDLFTTFWEEDSLVIDESIFSAIVLAGKFFFDSLSDARRGEIVYMYFAYHFIRPVAQQILGPLIKDYNIPIFFSGHDTVNRTLDKVFLKIKGFSQILGGLLNHKLQITGVFSEPLLHQQYFLGPFESDHKRFVFNGLV